MSWSRNAGNSNNVQNYRLFIHFAWCPFRRTHTHTCTIDALASHKFIVMRELQLSSRRTSKQLITIQFASTFTLSKRCLSPFPTCTCATHVRIVEFPATFPLCYRWVRKLAGNEYSTDSRTHQASNFRNYSANWKLIAFAAPKVPGWIKYKSTMAWIHAMAWSNDPCSSISPSWEWTKLKQAFIGFHRITIEFYPVSKRTMEFIKIELRHFDIFKSVTDSRMSEIVAFVICLRCVCVCA